MLRDSSHVQLSHLRKLTYTLKKSITSGDRGEAPDPRIRTRPPSFSFILLKTNLSQIGDAFLPGTIVGSTCNWIAKHEAGTLIEFTVLCFTFSH